MDQHQPDNSNTGTIAVLIHGNEGYGNAQSILGLFGVLRQWGWQTPIISLSDGSLTQRCRDLNFDVTMLGLGVGPSIRGRGSKLRSALQFGRMIRHQRAARRVVADAVQLIQPDVIHVIKSNLLDLAGSVARGANIVGVWEMDRAIESRYPFQINRRYYQRVCHRHGLMVTANSMHTASTMESKHVHPIVIHLGIDPDRFNIDRVQPVTRSELGIPDTAIVFGIVGSLSTLKGQDRFLKAMAQRMEHDPPLHLLLIGEPTTETFAQEFRTLISETNLGDRVHMIGHVDAPERYYKIMDIAANTYIWAEGFGLSVVEAMMMGTPVLAHARGGPAETIIDRKTGWHMPQPTVEAMVAGIDQVLADRSRWLEMGTAARQHAIKQFTIERQAQQYLDVLTPRLNT